MAKITVLGLGAMGSRMALRLIDAGYAVTVWNRSPEPVASLVAAGAISAATPAEAAQGAEFVLVMVRDDAASEAVWLDPDTGALSALRSDAVAIDCSTLSVDWVERLAREMAGRPIAFLDAPIAGSRPQADAGQLIFFVGGEAEVVARARPILASMAAAIHPVGGVGAGSVVKLAVNTLFGVQVAALAEILGVLARSDLDLARAVEVLGATPVCSPAAKGAAVSMLTEAFAPLFPVALVEKDFGYAQASADSVGLTAPVTASARSVFARAIQAGLGGEHLTAVARLYRGDV